ncbi:MAG: hypothetical protein OEZ22_07505 [Spirochaetia bacterium]|nr:hypothetical protein [Spirochaetia bacterium]
MKTTIKILAFTTAAATFTQVWPQEAKNWKSLRTNSESQKALELDQTEDNLDDKILEVNKSLGNYHKLQDVPVNYTPAQTKFTKGKDYIEIESYSFIGRSYNKSNIIGMKTKKMKLFYNGDKLSKIITSVMEENYEKRTKTENTVIDESPATKDNLDIKIINVNNGGVPYEVNLGNMENTLSNPMRIKFKREFYLKNLVYFDKMYHYTVSFQLHKDKKNDAQIIKDLSESVYDN